MTKSVRNSESAENAQPNLRIEETPGFTDIATWAVAVLDDGSEIRMRNLGYGVEIRGWDQTLSCNPPPIEVERISPHTFDVRLSPAPEPELDYVDCTCGHPNADHENGVCPFTGCGCGALYDDESESPTPPDLPIHRTEAGYPNCFTCDGGGCLDCTDPA